MREHGEPEMASIPDKRLKSSMYSYPSALDEVRDLFDLTIIRDLEEREGRPTSARLKNSTYSASVISNVSGRSPEPRKQVVSMRLLMLPRGSRDCWGSSRNERNPGGMGRKPEGAMTVAFPMP